MFKLGLVLVALAAPHHHHQTPPPMRSAVASWYYDAGQTASGYHAWFGVASKYLAFGTHVRICYGGRCVTAVVDDRGPYVWGRDFDLNQNCARALGMWGVAPVQYRIV